MRIGIDIDNVLCKTLLMTEKEYNKHNDGDFKKLSKWEQYEYSKVYEKDIFEDCPLFEKAKDVVNKLYNDNMIYFITARTNRRIDDIEKRTLDYLGKNGINYNDIFFGLDDKLDKYNELNLDIMIDDDIYVYESIINDGGKCILFSSYLNQNSNAKKACNWDDVYKMVMEVKNG